LPAFSIQHMEKFRYPKGGSMRLVKGAEIFSSQGEKLGTLERVIIDPGTKEVTHLVIGKGFLFTTNKIVAMDMVNPELQENISLLSPKQNLDEFQDFEETHYVNLDQGDTPERDVEASYWYPPTNAAWWRTDLYTTYPAMPLFVRKTKQNIPEGTIAVEEGAKVISRDDKHVGNIEQVIVDPQDNRVTHFVISEGLLFKEQKLIPVVWISTIDEHEVRLSVDADLMDRLPGYQPTR
jgi:uncharacterized protein YrrD